MQKLFYSTGLLSDFSSGVGLVIQPVPDMTTKSTKKSDSFNVKTRLNKKRFIRKIPQLSKANALKSVKNSGDSFKAKILTFEERENVISENYSVGSPIAPIPTPMFANEKGLVSLIQHRSFLNWYNVTVLRPDGSKIENNEDLFKEANYTLDELKSYVEEMQAFYKKTG